MDGLIGTGSFAPGPPHVLRGTFTLARIDGVVALTTSDAFFFDGSPAPGFALTTGNDFSEQQARRTEFGRLPGSGSLDGRTIEVVGRQIAFVPPSLDIGDFDTVFLWCFKVPFLLGRGIIVRP